MIVLGIDPGSQVTGFGLIEVEGSSEKLLHVGVIRLDRAQNQQLRLAEVYKTLCALIEKHLPDFCAVEMPVYGKNPQSMLKLGRVQAAAMLAALSHEIPVVEYTPKEVKKAVTGNGNASKEQVRFMVRSLLSISDEKDLALDASDALAVGLCHAQRNGKAGATGRKSWNQFIRENPERVV
jgi:crossover junction endodeoxyribonuclease RuvC